MAAASRKRRIARGGGYTTCWTNRREKHRYRLVSHQYTGEEKLAEGEMLGDPERSVVRSGRRNFLERSGGGDERTIAKKRVREEKHIMERDPETAEVEPIKQRNRWFGRIRSDISGETSQQREITQRISGS